MTKDNNRWSARYPAKTKEDFIALIRYYQETANINIDASIEHAKLLDKYSRVMSYESFGRAAKRIRLSYNNSYDLQAGIIYNLVVSMCKKFDIPPELD